MELIRIGEKSVKATLTEEDMRQYALVPSEGDTASFSVTRRSLRGLLEHIREQSGADFSGERAVVRFFRSRDGGCELYITAAGAEPPFTEEKLAPLCETEEACSLFWVPDGEALLAVRRILSTAEAPGYAVRLPENGLLFLFVQSDDPELLSVLSEFGEQQNFFGAAELILEHGVPLSQF